MWLVDTETLGLQQVIDEKQHPFAILSHTWGEEEVTFQDMHNLDTARLKSGFEKIQNTCRLARRFWKYAWIDTCCIDKTSSAELTEAINSMFRYYRTAEVCYVFLSDFSELPVRLPEHRRLAEVARKLESCKWFTRGWTLQELIAPTRLDFFDDHWNFLGEKADLEASLSQITQIDESVLRDSSRLYAIPLARRMSWASHRQTAREEDIAYCLLGIFDITMPLLYGEGSKSFLRLQQEIAMKVSDLSIFAWESSWNLTESSLDREDQGDKRGDNQYSGIFAGSPRDFSTCAKLRMHRTKPTSMGEMTMSNIGLRLSDAQITTHLDTIVLSLNCLRHSHEDGSVEWIGVYLERFGPTYIRTKPFLHTSASKHFWGKLPERNIHPVYFKPWLLPDEVKRTNALLENIIVVRYDESTAELIDQRHGIPSTAYTEIPSRLTSTALPQRQTTLSRLAAVLESEQRLNPSGGAVFRTNVAEEFDGIHLISVKTGLGSDATCKIAVVVSLQWDGEALRLSYALYEGNSAFLQYIDREPAPTDSTDYLERLQDYFLENRAASDLTGLRSQERLPATIRVPSEASECIIWIQKDRGLIPRTDGCFYLVLKSQMASDGVA